VFEMLIRIQLLSLTRIRAVIRTCNSGVLRSVWLVQAGGLQKCLVGAAWGFEKCLVGAGWGFTEVFGWCRLGF
jgi:hypothetical protein